MVLPSHACRSTLAALVEGQDEIALWGVDAAVGRLSHKQQLLIPDLSCPSALQVSYQPPPFPCGSIIFQKALLQWREVLMHLNMSMLFHYEWGCWT